MHESEDEPDGRVEELLAFDPDVEIVRLHGLCARPELNGVFGIITGAKRADGRYPVKLYPEDRSVLVLACNLTMVGGYDDDYSYSHDEDSESDDSGDDHPSFLRRGTRPTPFLRSRRPSHHRHRSPPRHQAPLFTPALTPLMPAT